MPPLALIPGRNQYAPTEANCIIVGPEPPPVKCPAEKPSPPAQCGF